MAKPRVAEPENVFVSPETVADFELMQRQMRDRGQLYTKDLLDSHITQGHALEIGPGPGYLGLDWLKQTNGTTLAGLDISTEMNALAEHNAKAYGLADRTRYHQGNCDHMPFEDSTFDGMFACSSLHEWNHPEAAFEEIWRVLKPGGHYCIVDLRRDMNFLVRAFLWFTMPTATSRQGFLASVDASYTLTELQQLAAKTPLKNGKLSVQPMSFSFSGCK